MSAKSTSWIRSVIHAILAVGILFVGVKVFGVLVSMRKPPVRMVREIAAPLVNAQTVTIEDLQMRVKGFGTVQPKVEVSVASQVAGVVVRCHPNFVNGGILPAGEASVEIDPRDYKLAVENALSLVATAQVRVDQETAEAAVARQEWNQLHPGEEPSSPLVVREPQIRQARASLQAAEAQLAKAKLDLERTSLCLPYPVRIAQKNVDLGQYVTPGQTIATVYSTEKAEIVIPLEDRELAWFDIPPATVNGNGAESSFLETGGKPSGSEAEVLVDFAGTIHRWKGTVVRTQGRIDPVSRMVRVVVEVKDPFVPSDGRPPLVPGMFVEVSILGKSANHIARIPRYAVHNGRQVWVVAHDLLEIREVQVLRFDEGSAYVSKGLTHGDIVITSPLDTVTDRMKIRVELDKTQTAKGGNAL
ncbi:MAG: efflux RND transporter periplasmic adaptor subunit [Phycisphaerae bacterium]|nr:efflux RND transporter periplasmic adaptor subunit [Phycisphaerae bacterium]